MRSPQNYLLIVLALIAVGASALAWRQHQELLALRAAALTSGERADWQKRVWTAQKRTQELEHQLAAARPAGPTGTADPAQRGQTPGAAFGRAITGFASMMDRPEMARLMAIQQKAQVDARYAALFKKLGLSPEKLAQLKALLGDKLSVPVDVLAAASQQGVNPMQNPQDFRQLVQNAQAEIDDKIKTLLDPAAYTQYQNYVQTEPQRAVVNQLQQTLSYTDAALSAAQTDQLVQILANTSPQSGEKTMGPIATYSVSRPGAGVAVAVGVPPPEGMAGFGGSPITDAAVSQAQTILTPTQVQALQEIQQQQQAAAQLRQQMFQSASAAGLPPPPGPPPGS